MGEHLQTDSSQQDYFHALFSLRKTRLRSRTLQVFSKILPGHCAANCVKTRIQPPFSPTLNILDWACSEHLESIWPPRTHQIRLSPLSQAMPLDCAPTTMDSLPQ